MVHRRQTERERHFLDRVVDAQYKREIINGLAPFLDERAPADMLNFYSPSELVQLGGHPVTLRNEEVGIDTRESAEDLARRNRALGA